MAHWFMHLTSQGQLIRATVLFAALLHVHDPEAYCLHPGYATQVHSSVMCMLELGYMMHAKLCYFWKLIT